MKRLLRVAAAVVVASALYPLAHAGASHPATYTNPVSSGFADTFADPSLIRGRDGAWYAYGTSDPLKAGEGTPHQVPMARSADLVHWTHAGDALAIRLGERQSIAASGSAGLELLIVGVSRNMDTKNALMMTPPPGRGRGRGN